MKKTFLFLLILLMTFTSCQAVFAEDITLAGKYHFGDRLDKTFPDETPTSRGSVCTVKRYTNLFNRSVSTTFAFTMDSDKKLCYMCYDFDTDKYYEEVSSVLREKYGRPTYSSSAKTSYDIYTTYGRDLPSNGENSYGTTVTKARYEQWLLEQSDESYVLIVNQAFVELSPSHFYASEDGHNHLGYTEYYWLTGYDATRVKNVLDTHNKF